jgi:hypothetical protein
MEGNARRSLLRCDDTIKMYFKEVVREGVNCFHLAQDSAVMGSSEPVNE